MKRFMFLHFGFEKPSEDIMMAWQAWFQSIADRQIEQGGFAGGREITKKGTRDLPWDLESIENLDEAEKLAAGNPIVSSIRVYELR